MERPFGLIVSPWHPRWPVMRMLVSYMSSNQSRGSPRSDDTQTRIEQAIISCFGIPSPFRSLSPVACLGSPDPSPTTRRIGMLYHDRVRYRNNWKGDKRSFNNFLLNAPDCPRNLVAQLRRTGEPFDEVEESWLDRGQTGSDRGWSITHAQDEAGIPWDFAREHSPTPPRHGQNPSRLLAERSRTPTGHSRNPSPPRSPEEPGIPWGFIRERYKTPPKIKVPSKYASRPRHETRMLDNTEVMALFRKNEGPGGGWTARAEIGRVANSRREETPSGRARSVAARAHVDQERPRSAPAVRPPPSPISDPEDAECVYPPRTSDGRTYIRPAVRLRIQRSARQHSPSRDIPPPATQRGFHGSPRQSPQAPLPRPKRISLVQSPVGPRNSLKSPVRRGTPPNPRGFAGSRPPSPVGSGRRVIKSSARTGKNSPGKSPKVKKKLASPGSGFRRVAGATTYSSHKNRGQGKSADNSPPGYRPSSTSWQPPAIRCRSSSPKDHSPGYQPSSTSWQRARIRSRSSFPKDHSHGYQPSFTSWQPDKIRSRSSSPEDRSPGYQPSFTSWQPDKIRSRISSPKDRSPGYRPLSNPLQIETQGAKLRVHIRPIGSSLPPAQGCYVGSQERPTNISDRCTPSPSHRSGRSSPHSTPSRSSSHYV